MNDRDARHAHVLADCLIRFVGLAPIASREALAEALRLVDGLQESDVDTGEARFLSCGEELLRYRMKEVT